MFPTQASIVPQHDITKQINKIHGLSQQASNPLCIRANYAVLVFAIPVFWLFPSCVMSLVIWHSDEYHYNYKSWHWQRHKKICVCVNKATIKEQENMRLLSEKSKKNLAHSIYFFAELCNWRCEFGVVPGKSWPLYKNYINKQIEAKDMSTVANVSFQQNQSQQNRSGLMGTVSGYQHWPLAKATHLHHFCQRAGLPTTQHFSS